MCFLFVCLFTNIVVF